MKLIKIMVIFAMLSASSAQAKLIVKVSRDDFQRIADGKTVIHKGGGPGQVNPPHFYITDGRDGFYYGIKHIEYPLDFQNSTVIDTAEWPSLTLDALGL